MKERNFCQKVLNVSTLRYKKDQLHFLKSLLSEVASAKHGCEPVITHLSIFKRKVEKKL